MNERHIFDYSISCKTDPRAPHGFDRKASHSQGRYVCECEGWDPLYDPSTLEAAVDGRLVSAHIGTLDSFKTGREALEALINWEVQVALDPQVSSDARALIDIGVRKAADWLVTLGYPSKAALLCWALLDANPHD